MRKKIITAIRIAGFLVLLIGLILYGLCSKGVVYWEIYEPVVMAVTTLGTFLMIIGFYSSGG